MDLSTNYDYKTYSKLLTVIYKKYLKKNLKQPFNTELYFWSFKVIFIEIKFVVSWLPQPLIDFRL